MRTAMIIGGIVALLLGIVWLLQGVGILPGSVMTGQSFWAAVGLILIVCGGGVLFVGIRRKPSKRI